MLVITGTGRSGTSLLARFCHNCGYLVGGNWSEQVDGGMEEPIVREINRRIRGGAMTEADRRTIRDLNRRVVKDPRFTVPGVVDAWHRVRQDLKYLVLLREASKVVLSQKRHPEWFRQISSAEEIDSRVATFYRRLGALAIPHRTISFPEFLDQPDRVIELLCNFGGLSLDLKRSVQTWDSLVQKEKVHVQ